MKTRQKSKIETRQKIVHLRAYPPFKLNYKLNLDLIGSLNLVRLLVSRAIGMAIGALLAIIDSTLYSLSYFVARVYVLQHVVNLVQHEYIHMHGIDLYR